MGKLIFKMLLMVGIILGMSNYTMYIMTGKSPFSNFSLPTLSSFKFKKPNLDISNPFDESLNSGSNHAYKWTDIHGTVHYSSEPPPGIDSKEKLAEATAKNTLQKINVDPNTNLVQGETATKAKEAQTEKGIQQETASNAYAPGGAKKLMEDAKNIEKLLNDRHLKQQEVINNL